MRLGEQLELVEHREPVVIPVDQRGVHRRQVGQDLETEGPVEDVAARKAALVLGGVELGDGIDHVELGARTEAVEHLGGGLAPQCADLDDASGACRS